MCLYVGSRCRNISIFVLAHRLLYATMEIWSLGDEVSSTNRLGGSRANMASSSCITAKAASLCRQQANSVYLGVHAL